MLVEEKKQRLMAALAMLPAKERAAVVLREIEGLSTAEVAAALGSSEVTVRSQISKALVKLARHFESGGCMTEQKCGSCFAKCAMSRFRRIRWLACAWAWSSESASEAIAWKIAVALAMAGCIVAGFLLLRPAKAPVTVEPAPLEIAQVLPPAAIPRAGDSRPACTPPEARPASAPACRRPCRC